ncbi:MAG: hypothetical protein V1847_04985 [Candidatus Diapherotrites archaeon]
MIVMDSKGQVSFEYLLTLGFAVVLVVAASVLALNAAGVAQVAQTKILAIREQAIASLVGA